MTNDRRPIGDVGRWAYDDGTRNAKPISLSLHPALRRFVDHEIAAGHFPDTDALFNIAIAALCAEHHDQPTQEHRAYMRERLADAIASLDRGEGEPWDADDLKARVARQARSGG